MAFIRRNPRARRIFCGCFIECSLLTKASKSSYICEGRVKARVYSVGGNGPYVHRLRSSNQMIITSNRYTVRAEYAAENMERIREVMAELRAMQRTDITYRVFLQDNGKTFIHWRMCADEEASKVFD